MIYITGDCHGSFERFNASIFPEQKEMTKDDYVIICGDFGGVWNKDEESNMETMLLDWLDCKPFTTLFVDGNHENYERYNQNHTPPTITIYACRQRKGAQTMQKKAVNSWSVKTRLCGFCPKSLH